MASYIFSTKNTIKIIYIYTMFSNIYFKTWLPKLPFQFTKQNLISWS